MMKIIFLLFSLPSLVFGAATIFNGDYVKALKNKFKLAEDMHIAVVASDPTSVAYSAPAGSIIMYNGNLYRKTDAGSSINYVKLISASEETDPKMQTLTSGEVDQLENIDLNTISEPQWGILGTLDQSLTTSNEPTFAGIKLSDKITFTEIAAPSSPTAGKQVLWLDSTSHVLTAKNSDGIVTKVGSQFSKEGGYIIAHDAEAATGGATDWNVSASTNITWTADTNTYVRDAKSFKLAKPASDEDGDYVYYRFTINAADTNKALYESFDYYINDADYSSDYLVFDVQSNTASDWSGTTTDYTLTGSVDGRRGAFVFYTGADVYYQIRIKINTTTTTAWDVYFDNFLVGPDKLLDGLVITEWASYTPIWTASVTNPTLGNGTLTGRWRRVNDTMEVKIRAAFGASGMNGGNGEYYFSIPSGHTIDTTKLHTVGDDSRLGFGSVLDSGANRWFAFVNYKSTTTIKLIVSADGSSGYVYSNSAVSHGTPFTFGASDELGATFSVPILEWANQSALVSSTEQMNVPLKMVAYRAADQTGINTNNSTVKITIDTIENSNYSSALSGGTFTAPKTAYYRFNGMAYLSGANILANVYQLAFSKNSAAAYIYSMPHTPGAGASFRLGIQDVRYLVKGDTIDFLVHGTGNNSSSTYTVGGGTGKTVLSIEELPDFSFTARYANAEYKTATSSGYDLATAAFETGDWLNMTGNSLTIPIGTFACGGSVKYLASTGNATRIVSKFHLTNGGDTNSEPTALGTILQAGAETGSGNPGSITGYITVPTIRIKTTADTTIYLNSVVTIATAETGTITAYPYCERIQ